MKLLDYVKHPKEYLDKKEGWKHLAVVVSIFFVYSIFINLLNDLFFAGLFGMEMPARSIDFTKYPILFALLVPPICEEFAFRLGLRRTKLRVLISAFLITFLVFSRVLYFDAYSGNCLFQRVVFLFMVALIIYAISYKAIKKVKYPVYFYFMCCLFAMLHILYYYPFDISWVAWIYIILYALFKIPSAVILGYVRMGYGFMYSLILHTLFNAIVILLFFLIGH